MTIPLCLMAAVADQMDAEDLDMDAQRSITELRQRCHLHLRLRTCPAEHTCERRRLKPDDLVEVVATALNDDGNWDHTPWYERERIQMTRAAYRAANKKRRRYHLLNGGKAVGKKEDYSLLEVQRDGALRQQRLF